VPVSNNNFTFRYYIKYFDISEQGYNVPGSRTEVYMSTIMSSCLGTPTTLVLQRNTHFISKNSFVREQEDDIPLSPQHFPYTQKCAPESIQQLQHAGISSTNCSVCAAESFKEEKYFKVSAVIIAICPSFQWRYSTDRALASSFEVS
jgi:hypothetical protein